MVRKAVDARKPDFFIVGAPKCGTSAMHQYLRSHPDIFMPAGKETHFFGSDLRPPGETRDPARYLALFSGWKHEKRAGEASVWYLFSKEAAREIKAFSPQSDIIIMLRNPVEMIYAQYYQFLFKGARLPPFEEAIRTEEARRREFERALAAGRRTGRLFHTRNAMFSQQVGRYLDVFGRDRVRVILYDDFKADTRTCYRDTLRFLRVDPDHEIPLGVVNPSKRVRSRLVQGLLTSPVLGAAGKRVAPRWLAAVLLRGLKGINTRYVPRPPMEPRVRRELQKRYEADVAWLGELLDRDLSHWVRDPESSPR